MFVVKIEQKIKRLFYAKPHGLIAFHQFLLEQKWLISIA